MAVEFFTSTEERVGSEIHHERIEDCDNERMKLELFHKIKSAYDMKKDL